MTNEQSIPNSNTRYETTGYKGKNVPCMAIGCSNVAKYDIKIDLVDRYGDFCAECKRYFEERNLIVSCTTIDLGIGDGTLVKLLTDEDDCRIENAIGENKSNAQ